MVVVPDFLSAEERKRLTGWARAMRPHLIGNGPRRYWRRMRWLPRVDPLYDAVAERIQRFLALPPDTPREPSVGWYLSIIEEGGIVQPHTDLTPEGMRHLRANLFLQLPYRGGYPIIEMKARKVAPGTLLAFFPSEMRHYSQKGTGRRRRILLSFGFLVPAAYELPAELTRAA